MARARYLAREGRIADAEKAYRDLLAAQPDLKPCWAECFELLRSHGRREDALHLAEGARAQFGDSAFPLVLKGAALIELERYREALGALEQAIESDPDLALAWHELGYAAFRLGDRNRALLALDRAFALEPHTETLRLRGRILRDAGRYQAAEVAYEGAAQAAEHAEQRQGAEREIAITRRYAFYAPRRPEDLSPAERWFAETGTVVLAPDPGADVPDDSARGRSGKSRSRGATPSTPPVARKTSRRPSVGSPRPARLCSPPTPARRSRTMRRSSPPSWTWRTIPAGGSVRW